MSRPTDFPSVDISAFTSTTRGSAEAQARAAADLTSACHTHGFVAITGHGIDDAQLHAAFSVAKQLFALSHDDKMKAPHPSAPAPHRGYSAPGVEKIIDASTLREQGGGLSGEELARQIEGFHESYEVGSEANQTHYNIWLPEEVLPGFRQFTTDFYWQLHALARCLLDAFAMGLKLTAAERDELLATHSGHNNQLRLLHYPSIPADAVLEQQDFPRLPAHTDWSFFTMLFQDSVGGLELQEPLHRGGSFVSARPTPGTLVLNIGDMFMRLTNGYLSAALHRVSIAPTVHTDPSTGDRVTPERYSIPYFVSPDDDATIKTFPSCVRPGESSRFETLKFREYEAFRARSSYLPDD